MSSYGTRRSSLAQASPLAPSPIPLGPAPPTPYSPSLALSPGLALSPLSSSIGKSKRTTSGKNRRLSNASQHGLSQSVPGLGLSMGRVRSASISQGLQFEEEDGTAPAVPKSRREKGQTFECEKCSKVYRHSTCLTKHRWEHTAQWKEASKLLLSKHQQVQLLEGAAILAAVSVGTSLPDEKSYWPAAVSPPSSGLLGSYSGVNMHTLSASGPNGFGSPRFAPSSLFSDPGEFDASRSELSIDEDDEEEEDSPSPPRSGEADEDEEMMADNMFDLDLGGSGELPPASPYPHAPLRLPTLNDRRASPDTSVSDGSSPGPVRPLIRSSDSGFGSLGRTGTVKAPSADATAAAVAAANILAPRGAATGTAKVSTGFFIPSTASQ